MRKQELYHNYLSWAEDNLEEREARSTWRWVEEDLEATDPSDRPTRLQDVIQRLEKGEPIQYITGKAYFFDMELVVNDSVLIPRPETEELVFHVSRLLKKFEGKPEVLDVGTGSGCIALALKKKHPEAVIYACDIDPKALVVATENFIRAGVSISVFEGDFTRQEDFNDLPAMDVIICNPPYILESERQVMSYSTKYEPDLALFSKEDAMWAYESLMELGRNKLKPGGYIAMEMSEFHSEQIGRLASDRGMSNIKMIDDLQGKPRVLICQRVD